MINEEKELRMWRHVATATLGAIALVLTGVGHAGQAAQGPKGAYPGQLFGNRGKTPCVDARGIPIRCTVVGLGMPWCQGKKN